jgi:hypothetical protein
VDVSEGEAVCKMTNDINAKHTLQTPPWWLSGHFPHEVGSDG